MQSDVWYGLCILLHCIIQQANCIANITNNTVRSLKYIDFQSWVRSQCHSTIEHGTCPSLPSYKDLSFQFDFRIHGNFRDFIKHDIFSYHKRLHGLGNYGGKTYKDLFEYPIIFPCSKWVYVLRYSGHC